MNVKGLLEALQLIAAAIAALLSLSSVYIGWVTIVGGRVIPWESADEIRAMIDTSVKASEARTDMKIGRVIGYYDSQQCSDYVDRYNRGKMALVRNPNDKTAQDLVYTAGMMIATIPNCHI